MMKTRTARRIIVLLLIIAPLTAVAQLYKIPTDNISILFAGDLMQHKRQLQEARTEDGEYSYSGYYRHIAKTIKSADISVANLETPIGKSNFGGYPVFCAPDSFLYAAKDAGFNTFLFANNHCLDRGKKGVLHTLAMLDSLGVYHCGVYRNAKEREERYPLLIKKGGMRIAILNYTYALNGHKIPEPIVINLIDKSVMAKDIAKAKNMNADVIIACMHWGEEYLSIPPAHVKETADWLLEQGVDHIIGNHPHVIQPIEVRSSDNRPGRNAVVYSTGNLVSDMAVRKTDGGIMVRIGLKKIMNFTLLRSLEYLYTWISPRMENGKRDFTILPAATTVIEGDNNAESKLKLFLEDSRKLMKKHNSGEGISEFTIDTVRWSR